MLQTIKVVEVESFDKGFKELYTSRRVSIRVKLRGEHADTHDVWNNHKNTSTNSRLGWKTNFECKFS